MKFKYYSTLILLLLFNSPAIGMYRLTQGLRRGSAELVKRIQTRPIHSFSHYKPVLKRLTVASGGLVSLGGIAYGLQAYNKKLQVEQERKALEEQERKDYEEQVRKFTEEWFASQVAEKTEHKDSSSWWEYIQSFFTRKKVNKNKVDHDTWEAIALDDDDIVDEAKMICDQLMPDMPVIGWITSRSSGSITTTSDDAIPKPNTAALEIRFPIIGINPVVWKSASIEEKKAVLAHEYGHWIYGRKYGWDIGKSKEEEEFCDRVAVEVTGSAKGVVEFLQEPGGDIKFKLPENIDKWSSQEMQAEIERLRSVDRDFGTRSHPIDPLRAMLAIQHEKRLREQREQADFDEVVLPALTGA